MAGSCGTVGRDPGDLGWEGRDPGDLGWEGRGGGWGTESELCGQLGIGQKGGVREI